MIRRASVAVAIAMTLAACPSRGPAPSPSPSPSRSASPLPSIPPSVRLNAPDIKGLRPASLQLIVLESYRPLAWCDPDLYPVGVAGDERMNGWWSSLNAGAREGAVVLKQTGIAAKASATKQQIRDAYLLHKQLAAVRLEHLSDTSYRFTINQGATRAATQVTGFIEIDGTITNVISHPVDVMCPICLAASVRIDTPRGPLPVASLRAGDAVWVPSPRGRIAGRVVSTVRRFVGSTLLLRVRFVNGRIVTMAPRHPLLDGRLAGALRAGGGGVASIGLVPAPGGYTYDVLTTGEYGGYFAEGIPLRSTLFAE